MTERCLVPAFASHDTSVVKIDTIYYPTNYLLYVYDVSFFHFIQREKFFCKVSLGADFNILCFLNITFLPTSSQIFSPYFVFLTSWPCFHALHNRMASNSNRRSSSDERDMAEVKKALATGQAKDPIASPSKYSLS